MTNALLTTGWISQESYRVGGVTFLTEEHGSELFKLPLRSLRRWGAESLADPPKTNRFLGQRLHVLSVPCPWWKGRERRVYDEADLLALSRIRLDASTAEYKPPEVLDKDGTPLLTDKEIREQYHVTDGFFQRYRQSRNGPYRKTRVPNRPGPTDCEPADAALRCKKFPFPRRFKRGSPAHVWRSRKDDVERILRGEESEPDAGGGPPEKAANRKKEADERAEAWLKRILQPGPLPRVVILQLAAAEGIKRHRVYRIKKNLPVQEVPGPGQGRGRPARGGESTSGSWYWRLEGQELPARRPTPEEARARLADSIPADQSIPPHNGEGPQPASHGQEKRKGGRPRNPETAGVYEFCYTEYCLKGRPAAAVLVAAGKLFSGRAPKEEAEVIRNARRHAERNGLPWKRSATK